MAYERDKDHMTRGVGAIAAADHSITRYRRRIQIGQATRRRDRAMSAVAMGALGRINLLPDSPEGGEKRGSGSGRLYVPPPPPPRFIQPPPVISPPATTTADTSPSPSATPVTVTKPLPPVAPSPSPPASGGGGGGGGGVSTTGGDHPSPVFTPLPPLPDDDLSPTSPTSAPDKTNLLLWGGVAIAAYFLFFRKGTP